MNTQSVQRNSFTWLAYFSLGFFAYLLTVSPVIDYLREELQMNNSLYALHFSALALGMSLAGSLVMRLIAFFGRPRTFWLGGAGMCLGALCLIFGFNPYITVVGTFLMGLLGGNLLVMIQALLADQFGEKRTIALTESNVVAVIFSTLMPSVVWFGAQYLGGWRFALWLGLAFWLISFVVGYRMSFPAERAQITTEDKAGAKLPAIFWLYCFVLALGTAVEWSVAAWTIEFFQSHLQFNQETATLMLSVFFGAMIFGRILGSRLSHRYPARQLLFAAQLLTLISFPLLWLGNLPMLNITGLVLVGFGVANFYPLSLSVLSEIGQAQANRASAKASQSAGLAMLTVPLLLGVVADSTGIFIAYGIGMVFILLLPIIVGIAGKYASISSANSD